ncbi:MAG: hypothetical protein HFE81_06105 [Bacilli bacterium]|nr:hypothetical protein [Bacilli bacterium]
MKKINYKIVNMASLLLLLVFTCFISVGYSALNSRLSISGDLNYESQTLYRIIARSSKGDGSNFDFSVNPTSATTGVFTYDNDGTGSETVYFYRGNVTNNNVKFAGFCWKIVRTTGTGGVKLSYNGEPTSSGDCNNDPIVSTVVSTDFNSTYNQTATDYESYVLSNGEDSSIKRTMDQWYTYHMTSYTSKLEDTVWCNDRSIYVRDPYNPDPIEIPFFKPYERFSTRTPDLYCENASDRFTVSSSKGNGKLKYPAAPLTMDEVLLAGSVDSVGYLGRNQNWWTMTPGNGGGEATYIAIVSKNNKIEFIAFEGNGVGLKPAISLAPGIRVDSGTGTVSNPYVVS